MKLEVPKKFEGKVLKKKLIWFQNKWLILVITKELDLLEFEGSFLNLNLKLKLNLNAQNLENIQFRAVNTSQGRNILTLIH